MNAKTEDVGIRSILDKEKEKVTKLIMTAVHEGVYIYIERGIFSSKINCANFISIQIDNILYLYGTSSIIYIYTRRGVVCLIKLEPMSKISSIF